MATISTINPSFGSEVTKTIETFVNETKAIDIYEPSVALVFTESEGHTIRLENATSLVRFSIENTLPIICGIRLAATGGSSSVSRFEIFWTRDENLILEPPEDDTEEEWIEITNYYSSLDMTAIHEADIVFPLVPPLFAKQYRIVLYHTNGDEGGPSVSSYLILTS